MRSARSPSAASTIGPISPSPSGPTSTAAAPSPNSAAVFGSSKSVMRVSASAPITSTRSARPVSTWPAASRSAASQPVQAAPISIAPARSAPSACATSGAALGLISSGVIVATSTRSTSSGSSPASSTPMRSAIGPLGTTSAGTWWPSPVMRAVRAGAGVGAPLRVASRAIVRRSGGSVALRMGKLLRGRLDGEVGQDPLAEAGQHLARADLDEAARARLVQGELGLAPAHWAREGGGELGADVGERLGGHAREDGEARLVQLGLVERFAEGLDGGLHRGRVEGAGDVERQRAAAAVLGGLLGALQDVARAGED